MTIIHQFDQAEILGQFDVPPAEMALGDMENVLELLGTSLPDGVAAAFAFSDKRGNIAFNRLGEDRDRGPYKGYISDRDDIVVQFTWVVSVGNPARPKLEKFHNDGVETCRAERRAAAERKLAQAQAELAALD